MMLCMLATIKMSAQVATGMADTVVVDSVCIDSCLVDSAAYDVDLNSAVVSENGVAQISLDMCDSLMVSDVTDRYGVVYKDGKCGVYDIARRENVTDIEFDYLRYSHRIEMEIGFCSYFYWESGGSSGAVGIVEEDNHFMIITAPKEKDGE